MAQSPSCICLAYNAHRAEGHLPFTPASLYARGMFGFVALTRSWETRAQSLVQLNLELAKLESKKKATALGVAAGLALLAVVLVVYAIGFAFASAAAGISGTAPVAVAPHRGGSDRSSQRSPDSWPFASPRRRHLPSPRTRSREAERTVKALRSHV